MKEIISAVLVVVGLWQGTKQLKQFHDHVRKLALEKAAQGLPPLTPFAQKLTQKRSPPRGDKGKK